MHFFENFKVHIYVYILIQEKKICNNNKTKVKKEKKNLNYGIKVRCIEKKEFKSFTLPFQSRCIEESQQKIIQQKKKATNRTTKFFCLKEPLANRVPLFLAEWYHIIEMTLEELSSSLLRI